MSLQGPVRYDGLAGRAHKKNTNIHLAPTYKSINIKWLAVYKSNGVPRGSIPGHNIFNCVLNSFEHFDSVLYLIFLLKEPIPVLL